MKKITEKENKLVFTAEIEDSLANAIRRYITEIPVLAIDEVEISKNDSALYDETIAHRLGLIPLALERITDLGKEFKLTLESKKEGMVYSGEFKGPIKPVYENMPIVLLNKGQELSLVGHVKSGTGITHAKFSPGLMSYREVINVKVDKDCPAGIIDSCPKKVLVADGGKVKVEEPLECDMCEACMEYAQKNKKDCINVEPTGELIISLEGFGQIKTEDIFKKSIETLKKDLDSLQKQISKA